MGYIRIGVQARIRLESLPRERAANRFSSRERPKGASVLRAHTDFADHSEPLKLKQRRQNLIVRDHAPAHYGYLHADLRSSRRCFPYSLFECFFKNLRALDDRIAGYRERRSDLHGRAFHSDRSEHEQTLFKAEPDHFPGQIGVRLIVAGMNTEEAGNQALSVYLPDGLESCL